jgi:hypothetical protein
VSDVSGLQRRTATMLSRIGLSAFACAWVLFSPASRADERQANEDPSVSRVRLRLNAIETSVLLEHYERLVKRELGLQENVRACARSGDNRLAEYQQALQEAQGDLDATRKKLVALETEKRELIARLRKQGISVTVPEPTDGGHRTLEKILERLKKIEKRLEKLDRPK